MCESMSGVPVLVPLADIGRIWCVLDIRLIWDIVTLEHLDKSGESGMRELAMLHL